MQNPNNKSPMNYQNFHLSFQDFNLGENLTSSDDETTDSQSKSGYFCKDSKFPMAQNSVQSSLQCPSTSSSTIWAYDYNPNSAISSTKSSQKCILDHEDMRRSTNYEYGSSSTYNPMNQSNSGQNLSHNMLSTSCIEIQESADYNELPLDYNNWSNEDYSKCLNFLLNQSVSALHYGYLPKLGIDVVKIAKDPKASRLLEKFLELNNYYYIQRILKEVLNSFFEVMIDKTGHAFFVKLVEFCNDEQMELILSSFHSHMDLFLRTAFMKYGSKSIQMLIAILKEKPSLAKYCSKIVSLKLIELMTHRIGRHVVEKCFHVLNKKQNEVLYRGVISCFRDLATNESGFLSLNACIDYISNPLRKELLEKIADQSCYFASDRWGNYVVQHVLELRDTEVSSKIFSQLEKEYLRLAFEKVGCHVVQKCIESSKSGMISVVDVLLTDAEAIVRLAKHHYGNYVIYKALKSTKKHREITRHQALARVLLACSSVLVHNKPGKRVISTIKSLNQVCYRAWNT